MLLPVIDNMKKMFLALTAFLCLTPLMGQQVMEKITYYGHLYLESEVNGKKASFAFDTGSPYTCIDSTYIADSDLQYKNLFRAQVGGSGNNTETVRVIVNELTYTAGGKMFTSKISPIIQLKPVLGDQADGILGIDNMGGKVIAIDYAGEQMGFCDSLVATDGYTLVPIRYENNRIYVPLKVVVGNGKTIEGEGLVDLGSGESVLLTSAVAKQNGLDDLTPQMRYSFAVGGLGGASYGSDFRAQSASVGPFTMSDITMGFSSNTGGALANMEYIAIVGNGFWERFDMIIDLVDKQLFLRPNAKFDEAFKSPVRGFSFTDRSRTLGCWVVNCLYEGSNAEKAGLRQEDHITAVNGRDVKEITFEERRTLFDGMSAVTLTVQRGNASLEIAFSFDEPKI